MTENHEANEVSEHIEMPDNVGEVIDIFAGSEAAQESDAPQFHTVLEVWRETLKPARDLKAEPVTPQYANRLIQTYSGLTFADIGLVQEGYYDLVIELLEILEHEINSAEDFPLDWPTPEEDALNNAHHYKNLLMLWQQAFLQHELEWDHKSPTAAVDVAVLSEAHKMFFGPTGLTQFLDNIQFEYTDEDSEELGRVLDEQREAHLGSVK